MGFNSGFKGLNCIPDSVPTWNRTLLSYLFMQNTSRPMLCTEVLSWSECSSSSVVSAPRNPYFLVFLLFLFVLLLAVGDGTAGVCKLCFALLLCMSGLYKSLGDVQLDICATNHRATPLLCFLNYRRNSSSAWIETGWIWSVLLRRTFW